MSAGGPEREREKLFRQMTWIYVYGPPILAILIGVFGGFVLALFVPVDGTTFWQRWLGAVLLVLGLPTLAYIIKSMLTRP